MNNRRWFILRKFTKHSQAIFVRRKIIDKPLWVFVQKLADRMIETGFVATFGPFTKACRPSHDEESPHIASVLLEFRSQPLCTMNGVNEQQIGRSNLW
jgi:hypothetical protein